VISRMEVSRKRVLALAVVLVVLVGVIGYKLF
jgi:hypothetical protein